MTTPAVLTTPLKLFFSYAHKDEALRDKLIKHLSTLKRQGIITDWHDRRISPGTEWAGQISEHLQTAQIILLLISSDFIASDYCYDEELKVALERHNNGTARVIPVILRYTDWESMPFGKLQALPKDAKPVTSWGNQDKAFLDIVRGIRRVTEELTATQVTTRTELVVSEGEVPKPPSRHTPYQLRTPVADFVGREQEVKRLVESLQSTKQTGATLILRGMGGLGKTELAYAVAQQLAEEFPDGQLFLQLRGSTDTPLSAEQALQRVTQAFDIEAQITGELDQMKVRYRSQLHQKQVLILADDALNAEQVRPLQPPPGCALVITTRHRFTLPGAAVFDLHTLSEDAAVTLVLNICLRIGDAAPRLAQLCGLLPLALRVSANVLTNDLTKDVETYLEALADEQTRLIEIYDPGDPGLDVEAALQLSYEAMSEAAQTALRHISVFSSSFDLEAAKSVVDLGKVKPPAVQKTNVQRQRGRATPPDLGGVLSELYRRSLVDYDTETRRYVLHDLVRAFGVQRMTPEERERFGRYAMYYSGIVGEAEALYDKGGQHMMQGLALFDRERVHIDTAINWARRNKDADLLLTYVPVIRYIGTLRFHPRHELIPMAEDFLAAARRRSRREPEIMALNMLGGAHMDLWEMRQAVTLFTECLVLVRALRGHKRQLSPEAALLVNLGTCYTELGDIVRAIEFHEQSLTIHRQIGDRKGEAQTLNNLGNCYAELGNTRHAIEVYQQSLTIYRQIGDRKGEAQSLNNLGTCYTELGDIVRAIEFHEQSLTIYRQIGDRKGEAGSLGSLGNCYNELGEITHAIEFHEQSLAIKRQIGNRKGEADSLSSLGSFYADLGDTRRAIEFHEQSLAIHRQIGNRKGEAISLSNTGHCYADLGDTHRAIEFHQQSLAIHRQIGDRKGEATSLGNLGLCYTYLDETERAIELGEAALRISQELGIQPIEGYALRCLGIAYAAAGNIEQALQAQERALMIAQKVEDRKLQGMALNYLGEIYLQQGDIQKAVELFEQALSILTDIGSRQYAALSSWNLGEALFQQGDLARAAELMQLRVDFESKIGHLMLDEHSRRLAEVRERLQQVA